jgi:hypothetical protein
LQHIKGNEIKYEKIIIQLQVFYSAHDYIDPVTFVGGPITYKERVALLNEINQYAPLKRGKRIQKAPDQKAAGLKIVGTKVVGRPKGARNKQPPNKAPKTAKKTVQCTCKIVSDNTI